MLSLFDGFFFLFIHLKQNGSVSYEFPFFTSFTTSLTFTLASM